MPEYISREATKKAIEDFRLDQTMSKYLTKEDCEHCTHYLPDDCRGCYDENAGTNIRRNFERSKKRDKRKEKARAIPRLYLYSAMINFFPNLSKYIL